MSRDIRRRSYSSRAAAGALVLVVGGGAHLVLVETTGLSGAIRLNPIKAGQKWSMSEMGYCAPAGDGSRSGLTVIVDYRDDHGRAGTLTATMAEPQ
jgi:hypothetical protein